MQEMKWTGCFACGICTLRVMCREGANPRAGNRTLFSGSPGQVYLDCQTDRACSPAATVRLYRDSREKKTTRIARSGEDKRKKCVEKRHVLSRYPEGKKKSVP